MARAPRDRARDPGATRVADRDRITHEFLLLPPYPHRPTSLLYWCPFHNWMHKRVYHVAQP